MNFIHDHIVVGSGCTGSMAAQTLVEKGLKVTMVDVGIEGSFTRVPDNSFSGIRATDPHQYKYWLGESFEGISFEDISIGAQLTPARKYIISKVKELLHFYSDSFSPMESLAFGGLGMAWGLGCCVFSDEELNSAGLDQSEMKNAYQIVADRIGISGRSDDASKFTIGDLKGILGSVHLDENAAALLSRYEKKKKSINKDGFFLGRPGLALLTESKNNRSAYKYKDLDFYSDEGESAYRPSVTINELKKNPSFQYIGNKLVLSYSEKENVIEVIVKDIDTSLEEIFLCRKLILCPGVLGTARIVLRSNNDHSSKLPFLCNPYSYVPCLQPSLLGASMEKERIGFAQLSMFHDEDGRNRNVAMASIYSYRSLMLFRILKQAPLNFKDGIRIMQYLLPAITVMGIHQPDTFSENKFLQLKPQKDSFSGDFLYAEYGLNEKEKNLVSEREKKFIRAMRSLNCFAIKRINPGAGASIHYAGCLPFSREERQYALSLNGRLHNTNNVYVADGSGFSYLPAKGLTLSLMANAHRVAQNIANG